MRRAFYALEPGGWRDYVTLLHLPYTAWHLSYVVLGACLGVVVSWSRLGLTLLAFALALGIGAHALDELRGRPLATRIPDGVLVVAYNLELAGLHTDLWFGLAWGGFPVLTAAFAQTGRVEPEAVLAALAAVLLSLAQRRLSTQARHVRRRVSRIEGTLELPDGTREPLDADALVAPAEWALRALTGFTVVLAAALVVARL